MNVLLSGPSRLLLTVLAVGSGIVVGASLFYLLLLLAAAVLRRPHRAAAQKGTFIPSVVVVIPAHNEELVLAATLQSLGLQDYPAECVEIVVVADNCEDTTSAIARKWGAHVLERLDTTRRGKGYALEWAFSILLGEKSPIAKALAFVIVDADTVIAPNFLSVMIDRLQTEIGAANLASAVIALQGRYGVLNSQEGWRTSLMTAAFDLVNHVRLLGAANLGWTVGLKGNGMLFTRALLEKAQWQGRSITEDIDYGLDLLLHYNVKVGYEPNARVWAQMPEDNSPAASQRERWERGRYRLVRERVPMLFMVGLKRRSTALVAAAVDLVIPPLAELVIYLLLWGFCVGIGVRFCRFSTQGLALWAAGGVCFLLYVLGGLKAAGATRATFIGLLYAPLYIVWKIRALRRPICDRAVSPAFRRRCRFVDSHRAPRDGADSRVRERNVRKGVSGAVHEHCSADSPDGGGCRLIRPGTV